MAFVGSELFGHCNYFQVFAIPHENGRLDGSNKNKTVFSVIDVYIGSDIEDKESTVFAAVNIELLFLDGIYFFDLERVSFIQEPVVVRVVFLSWCFGLQNEVA